MWELIISMSFFLSVVIIWIQRKSIFELDRDVWEIEKAYKEKTGVPYQYRHRFFHSWQVKDESGEK